MKKTWYVGVKNAESIFIFSLGNFTLNLKGEKTPSMKKTLQQNTAFARVSGGARRRRFSGNYVL